MFYTLKCGQKIVFKCVDYRKCGEFSRGWTGEGSTILNNNCLTSCTIFFLHFCQAAWERAGLIWVNNSLRKEDKERRTGRQELDA